MPKTSMNENGQVRICNNKIRLARKIDHLFLVADPEAFEGSLDAAFRGCAAALYSAHKGVSERWCEAVSH